MKIVTAKMLISAIFGVGMCAGMCIGADVPIQSAAVISGGFSYVSWRIENGSVTV
jgi:hypothetical protein